MNKKLKEYREFVKRTWSVPIILALVFSTAMATFGRGSGIMLGMNVAPFWMVWIPAFISVIVLWLMILIVGLLGTLIPRSEDRRIKQ